MESVSQDGGMSASAIGGGANQTMSQYEGDDGQGHNKKRKGVSILSYV